MEQNKSQVDEKVVQGPLVTISIKDLVKSYGKKEVLKGLNLEVYEGELFGFIGRNGIGKSTTIDCVIGSKKFNSGEIKINDFDGTFKEYVKDELNVEMDYLKLIRLGSNVTSMIDLSETFGYDLQDVSAYSEVIEF